MKFVPCSLEEFDHVERKVEEGTYQFNLIEYQRFWVPYYRAGSPQRLDRRGSEDDLT